MSDSSSILLLLGGIAYITLNIGAVTACIMAINGLRRSQDSLQVDLTKLKVDYHSIVTDLVPLTANCDETDKDVMNLKDEVAKLKTGVQALSDRPDIPERVSRALWQTSDNFEHIGARLDILEKSLASSPKKAKVRRATKRKAT